jgi:hypothetical protein
MGINGMFHIGLLGASIATQITKQFSGQSHLIRQDRKINFFRAENLSF